jgi:hypothetical protein
LNAGREFFITIPRFFKRSTSLFAPIRTCCREDVLPMISEPELLFGQADPLAEQIELRAGPISLVFEEGSIRYLRFAGREILRRVYAAVRDHEWRTVPGNIRDLKIEQTEDTFRIAFVSEHNSWGVAYVWTGRIEGAADGTITFEFDGEAKSLFRRNRIGFCVLHPTDAVIGATSKVTNTKGALSAATFPDTIARRQPIEGFTDLTAISYEIEPGAWVTTEFEDDVFETEDQRNWVDNSFKTYCTPVSWPAPVIVQPGERVRQRIVVKVEGAPTKSVSARKTEPIRIKVGTNALAVPKIGFCASNAPLAFSAQMRLQQLRPAHLRVTAAMNAPDWQQPFADGFREATAIKTKVELALRLSGCPGEDLRDLITTFPEPFQHWAFTSSFARVLLSTFGEASTSKRSLEAFRGFLLKTGLSTLDVPIGVGTEGDLYDLNLRPPPRDADFFFWSMNPQVHASDIASITETPAGAAAQVRSMQEYFGDAPKAVSPITLRPRGGLLPDGTDPTIDPRQKSLFCAVWTVGMLSALTASRASSATFFETTGDKGLMGNGGAVFPVYHAFRAIAGCNIALPCEVSEPLAIAAFAVRLERGVRLIVGNYTRHEREVEIPVGSEAVVRRLNKETAAPALEQPDSLWSATTATPISRGRLRLAPFETLFVDQPSFPEAF